jgi:hypothetical protein
LLVTIPLSLAPFLGKLSVPGFTALLEVFPVNLREPLIAFGGLCMTLPAIGVQAYYATTARRTVLRVWLLVLLVLSLVLVIALYFSYTLVIVQVPYLGGDKYVRYVVGDEMIDACVCSQQRLDIAACVGRSLSFNPALVEACFAAGEIRQNKALLGITYLALLASLGTSLGLLTLADRTRRRTRA